MFVGAKQDEEGTKSRVNDHVNLSSTPASSKQDGQERTKRRKTRGKTVTVEQFPNKQVESAPEGPAWWRRMFQLAKKGSRDDLKIVDGVLYKRVWNPHADYEWKRCVRYKEEQQAILEACHDDPSAGHLGAARTIRRIQSMYFWSTLKFDTTKYVKRCQKCQRFKVSTQKPPGKTVGIMVC